MEVDRRVDDVPPLDQLGLKDTVAGVQLGHLATDGLRSNMARTHHPVSHPPKLIQLIIDHLTHQ